MNKMLKPKIVNPQDVPPIQGYCGLVWELIDTPNVGAQKLSVALVTVDAGQSAQPHFHKTAEEIYFILEGVGEVTVGSRVDPVAQGYAVFIPPGHVHAIKNTGPKTLRLLAINSPPYDPADTFFP